MCFPETKRGREKRKGRNGLLVQTCCSDSENLSWLVAHWIGRGHYSVISSHALFFPPPSGADPKSVLCVFFKQGCCSKGDKCKFSHDLSLEGKAEKRSMYVDSREYEDGKTNTTVS